MVKVHTTRRSGGHHNKDDVVARPCNNHVGEGGPRSRDDNVAPRKHRELFSQGHTGTVTPHVNSPTTTNGTTTIVVSAMVRVFSVASFIVSLACFL